MSRVSRKSLSSKYFHVIVQGIEKKYIFQEYKTKEKYRKLLVEKMKEHSVKILAYCIMDNHAHMLIYTEKIEELSSFMKSVNTSFALFYNRINNRVGYVFRSRFLSESIKSEAQLERTLTYIHLNPVVAGMCRFPELYLFSSYNDFIKKRMFVDSKTLQLLYLDENNYIERFKFIHYMFIEGLEFEK